MFVIWDDLPSRDKRVPLLEVFNDLLQARVDLNQNSKFRKLRDYDLQVNSQSFESKLASALAAFQQSLVDDVYINAMMEADSEEPAVDTPYKVNAIRGLVLGSRIPGFLSDYHKGTVIQEFSKMAVNHSESEEIHHELITALQQISIEDVTGYKDLTVQTFMAELPDRLDSSTADFTEPANKIIFLLNTLTEISCTETCKVDVVGPLSHPETSFKFRIFEIFQETLLKRLHNLVQHSDQLPYSNAILGAIYRGLQLFDQALEKEETAHLTQIPSTVPAFRQLEAPAEALTEVDNPAPLSATGPYTWILMDLYQKLVCQKPHQGGPLSNLHYMGLKVQFQQDANGSDMFFSLLGRISTLVLRSTQTTPVNNFLFNAEKDGQPSQIWYLFCVEPPTNAIEISQQNLEHGPAEKCLMNVLSMSLLAGIRRTVSRCLNFYLLAALILGRIETS
jgi:DNA repair/transcription protein MET18/MMS19